MILRLVFFATLIGVSIASTCPHSTSARIQECVRPVAEYAKIINNQDSRGGTGGSEFGSAFSLPNMGGRVFNELCRLIAKFNGCVKEHRRTCEKHVTIALIDSSYGYLCNDGYNTFMESAECLMELDRKPTVKRCHDETLKEIETANTDTGVIMEAKLDRMCEALNFFSGCVRSPIKQQCGLSAWQVIYQVLKDTTNTLMPACQFTGTSAKLTSFQQEKHVEEPHLLTVVEPDSEEEMTSSTVLMTTSTRPPTTTTSPKKTMRKNIQAELNYTLSYQSKASPDGPFARRASDNAQTPCKQGNPKFRGFELAM
ncbi:unnamed protein product [Caenorhabditis auriculariae]|uniref:DUF19 domain-containing protein n=1 Tax=Caenorhabditis auriculariae TaxID=2777116 RepID=A0A8S1GR14_9PELO|nr:unnamed protein product [Caenorhabditis auriculariae]